VLSIDERPLEDGSLLTVLEGQYLSTEGIPVGQPAAQPPAENPRPEPSAGTEPTIQENERGAARGEGAPASDAPRGGRGPTIQENGRGAARGEGAPASDAPRGGRGQEP
jgi:hypothetical protein